MSKKKKIKNTHENLNIVKSLSKEDIESFVNKSNEGFKQAIEEHLESEPIIEGRDSYLLEYTGNNASQMMEFCKAYHMICEENYLILLKHVPAKKPVFMAAMECLTLRIKLGQFMVKEDNTFKVID